MTPAQVAKPIVLDLLAAIVFASVFFIAKRVFQFSGLHSVYIATAAGMAIGIAQFAAKKISRAPIGPLQWLSLGVVVGLGTMTIVLHQEHYIQLKPTVIDIAVGLFMAARDWMTPYLPAEVRANVPRRTIFLAEKLWAAVLIFFGLVNIAVAFFADFEIWALYATFVPTAIIVALFFVQYAVFERLAQRNRSARIAGTT